MPPSGDPLLDVQPTTSVPLENPAWDLVDVLLTVVFAVIALNVLAGVAILIARAMPRFHNVRLEDLLSNALIFIPVQLLAYLVIVGFMVLIVRIRHGADLMDGIGWNAPNRKTAALALFGGIGLAILSQIVAGLLSRWTPASLPVERLFEQPTSAYIVSIFAIFVAPIVEELFFRGFLYPALAQRTGTTAAIWLTALAFTVLHGAQLSYAWAALAPILVVGLVLTIIRAVSRSVALSVLVHTGYNGAILGTALISTHGFSHPSHF